MGDYEKLNRMGEDELRSFAMFAYTSYPTLMETHEKRQAFARDYPNKVPYQRITIPYQMELPFEQEVDETE